MIDLSFLQTIDLTFIGKMFVLFLIGIYTIFVVITVVQVRSLNRIVIIKKTLGSTLLQSVAVIYLLTTIFLFVAALVIL